MVIQQKIQSIRLAVFCKEAQLIPAYKYYSFPQCYHRVRMKIFNHQNFPEYQHQIQGWNHCRNLLGCKHNIQQPQGLQFINLPHSLVWIHIQIHGLKKLQNIRRYTRFSKPGKHKRHPGKFNTDYAILRATLGKISAPKKNSTLLPTIFSNYWMISTSTIIRVKRKL